VSKNVKNSNFQTPYLPQIGADSHGTKSVFLRSLRAIRCTGQIGAPAPLSGFSPKVTPPHRYGEPWRPCLPGDRPQTPQFAQGIHSEPTDVRRRKSDEGISRTALGQKIRLQFPLKNFGARVGDRLWYEILRTPKGYCSPVEGIFCKLRAFFTAVFIFPKILPNFGGPWRPYLEP